MIILALDLGKFNSVACRFDTESHATEFRKLESDRSTLRKLLAAQQPDLVVMEACLMSGWVSDLAHALKLKTLVASPNEEAWKWKNVKRKTDRDDALKLARLAALGQITPVHVPSSAGRQYRALIKYRKRLLGRTNRIQNTLRAVFLAQGVPVADGAAAWTAMGLEQMGRFRKPLDACRRHELWRGQVDLELEALTHAQQQLKGVERRLDALAQQSRRVQLLMTIPGVGRCGAEVVVAYLDEPQRFANARQVSAYAGFAPRRFQSGEMDRSGRISCRGPRVLRSLLVEVAWVSLRYNPWAQATYERIRGGQKTRKKQAIIAVARKLLVRCWVMLLRNEPWDASKGLPAEAA